MTWHKTQDTSHEKRVTRNNWIWRIKLETLSEIYLGKTKDIVNGLRSIQTLQDRKQAEALRNDLVMALQKRPQTL
ncbi:Hypothetical predicted protein [Octopus vulgaris]|uniref:Uncharacterized protein n=1 Tax=Octopus vulgaris TaxID=6645 RepID=A0AA36B709_OCTVU|nr:Hypothetical predicted protein [Octopus vulgaris]